MCDLGTRDLQTLTKTLVASGGLATPPTEEVARRARRIQQRRVRTAAVSTLALLMAVTVSVRWAAHNPESSRLRVVDRPTTTTTTPPPAPLVGPDDAVSPPPTASTTSTTVSIAHTPQPLHCLPGENGGATDRGVDAETIHVTMTETLRFPDRYTTLAAYDAVRAVFAAVNRAGGICGRLLDLRLVNPVWGSAPWEPASNAVAGIGGPLDENVDAAITEGFVDRSRTPLVTTGLTPAHFGSPWVWPVLPPAETITRVAVDHSYRQLGARTFALVYEIDPMYLPAATALEEYVATLPGARVVTVDSLNPNDDSYDDEAFHVARACGTAKCDVVLFAASDRTMAKWSGTTLVRGRLATAGLPSFATSPYVDECVPLHLRTECDRVHVWTGPALAPEASGALPMLTAGNAGDVTLVDSARVGALRLVDALRAVGPNVTRERLRAALEEEASRLALVQRQADGRRVFDIPTRAWRPTERDDTAPVFAELRPFTNWLRDPYSDWMTP